MQKKQVLFLRNVMGLTQKSIHEIVGVAITTIRTWCNKFLNLLDEAKKIFSTGFEKIGETVKKVRLTIKGVSADSRIEWDCKPIMNPSGYVVEMYEGNKLLWLKVGMTERPARQRMKEHLRYWANLKDSEGNKVYKDLRVKVKALYPAISHEGAEITESALREAYKEKYPDQFIPNDRFKGIKYEGIEKLSERFQTFRNLVQTTAEYEPCAA